MNTLKYRAKIIPVVSQSVSSILTINTYDVAFRTESQSTLKYIFRLGNEQSPTSGPRRMHIGQSLISLLSGMRRHSVTGGPGDRGTGGHSGVATGKTTRGLG